MSRSIVIPRTLLGSSRSRQVRGGAAAAGRLCCSARRGSTSELLAIRKKLPGHYHRPVVGVLTLLFILVPIAELYVIIQVGHVLGVLNTLALLVVMGFLGAWLMKREGLGVLRRAQRQIDAGVVPGRELVDGALIVLGGALMLAPGFLTDIVGMFLLLPPVRATIRGFVRRRLPRRFVYRRFQ